MDARLVAVGDGQLAVSDWGAGEPILLLQTALTADELLPLARQDALGRYRKVLYHRRGYGRSSAPKTPPSIRQEAHDARSLLAALGLQRAHIVGASFSAAIALQLVADTPDIALTLTVVEPPPVVTSYGDEFRAANDRLLRTRREHGAAAALDEFMTMLVGDGWRAAAEGLVAGSVDQMERDAATFFDDDVQALLGWEFDVADAARVTCPMLYVGGADSGPWFAEVRDVILRWRPNAEDVVLQGADHALTMTHATELGEALGAFLSRHTVMR